MQDYLSLSCTVFLCWETPFFEENLWLNIPQGYLTPSCAALLCRARSPFEVNWLPHCPQGYLTPSCTALWCSARFPLEVNWVPHCIQGYLNPSWTALLCWARDVFVDTRISQILHLYYFNKSSNEASSERNMFSWSVLLINWCGRLNQYRIMLLSNL